MKPIKNVFLTALTLAALSAGAWAETPGSGKPAANDAAAAAAPAPPTVTAADVQSLKDALAAQQLQIERLTQQLQRQQDWQTQQAAAEASAKANAAQTHAVPQQQLAELTSGIAIQQNGASASGLNLQETTPDANAKPNPLESPVVSIHFKGITITPSGFVAAEFVRRSRTLQFVDHAGRFAEFVVGVLRLRPPVAAYHLYRRADEERRVLQLCFR
jgi:hypothetical protein